MQHLRLLRELIGPQELAHTLYRPWLNTTEFIALVSKIDALTIHLTTIHYLQTMFTSLFLQSIVGLLTCGDYSRCSI